MVAEVAALAGRPLIQDCVEVLKSVLVAAAAAAVFVPSALRRARAGYGQVQCRQAAFLIVESLQPAALGSS